MPCPFYSSCSCFSFSIESAYSLTLNAQESMNNYSLFNYSLKIRSTLLAIFLAIIMQLQGNLEADEYYSLDRRAYPVLCESHFDNNKATAHTWLEADSQTIIESFRDYLELIPKPYIADCESCDECRGVRLNLHNECEWPVDSIDAFNEIHKCHQKNVQSRVTRCKSNSDHCQGDCWDGAYFRRWNQDNIHFFRHFLKYSSENTLCNCYWPEINLDAVLINDKIYGLFKEFADEEVITPEYSEYWNANEIGFDYDKGKIFEDEYYPNSHGMAGSLTTYTFFYSQYQQTLLSVTSFMDENFYGVSDYMDQVYLMLEELQDDFTTIYDHCLECHPHPKIYYERGMLKMHSGNIEEALSDIHKLMDLAKTDQYKNSEILTSEMYQQEGESYADIGMYDKAIASLTEAIKLDPKNQEAYFHRAHAYFEKGDFDQSLLDYLASNKGADIANVKAKTSKDFSLALIKGLTEGGKVAAIEFVPSLCNTAYGLGKCLWCFVQQPVNATVNFCNACYETSGAVVKYIGNLDQEQIDGMADELKNLYQKYNRLSDTEKGQAIGYCIGKYGVDLFAGAATVKCVAAVKNLKNANKACNLEAMVSSKANQEAMRISALEHAAERELFFKDVKLHVDRQNKHISGKHNYIHGRSILEHHDPQRLLDQFAGKGTGIGKRSPGNSDYRESVNFKEFIGYHVDKDTGVKTATNWGEIRYSKDGAHIIPAFPK